MTNSEISDIFSFLAKLMDIHQENSFKAKSYANAAFQLDKLPIQLTDLPKNEIAFQKGIGESTAKKIIELLETGQLEQLNELIVKTPEGILELMKIKGIGPKKIITIWHDLGIESPGELLYACNENRLIHYKGFGEKSQDSIRESLEFYFNNQQRFLFAEIEQLGLHIHQILLDNLSTKEIYLTGELHRQNEIVDILEFVVCLEADQVKSACTNIAAFHFVSQVTKEDVDIVSYTYQERIPINILCCNPTSLSSVLFKTNSSPEFIEEFNLQFGNDFIKNNQPVFENEAAIFEKAHLPFIPPFAREKGLLANKSALERLPHAIQLSEIKGVIHSHSTWSDGKNTMVEMAQACINKGYEYLVMSDHSVSSFYANGLSIERIQQQHIEIDQLNQQLKPFKIFKSIECDILHDGRLDYSNEILSTFDIVITSIHQNLKMTEDKAMER
ncbi:MAG: DNA polymerase/3'-5' exonuclease PolX, partial [Chitinophagaceae bacterium]|nr:DNA polymerase/3'-5' exonuclease PolX [Chitinophagaceae bacterium]